MDFYGTLGLSCQDQDTILALFRAGMTGARLNLSHTSLARSGPLLQTCFWPAARQAGVDARLVIDLQGPELRVGELPRPLVLEKGRALRLGSQGIPVPRTVLETARPGDQIALDDSALLLEVEALSGSGLDCRILRGGVLEGRKSLSILGVQTAQPPLTQEDLESLALAGELGVTDVLQPFVRNREDVLALRRALDRLGLSGVRIMAKIENRQGIDHLDQIIPCSDEVCIARGDLGNSIPLWELPSAQKYISRRCRRAGRPFCVSTQLLWSMQEREVPTRAEVSDIYNAVLDGAAALMLTGETAAGRYPVQAMEYLVNTARRAEKDGKSSW